jgi:PAS domain S-box-containing protein
VNRRFLRRHRADSGGGVAVAEPPLPERAANVADSDLGGRLIYDAFVGSPVAMAMVATDGSLLRCNAAFLGLLGARAEADLTGSGFADYVHPRDRGALKGALARFAEGESASWKRELRLTCPDGRVAWGQATLSVVRDLRGRPLMIFAHVDDVTERRQIDHLRGLRRSIGEVLARSEDVEATCTEVLRLICGGLAWDLGALWLLEGETDDLRCQAGWSSDGPVDARSLPPADPWAGHFALALKLASNTTVVESAEPLRWPTPLHDTAAGTWRTGLCFPIRGGGGLLGVVELYRGRSEPTCAQHQSWFAVVGEQVGAFIARKRHETELARLSAELERHAADLERSNHDLERYAGIVSHDLSQPLRVVGGYASLLLRRHSDVLDEEGCGYLKRMVGGVDRMQTLIDDLLDYARVGAERFERNAVDTRKIVESVVQALQPLLDAEGAHVDIGPLPPVAGDARHLERVFDNVIGNAIKFRSDEPPHVAITATRDDQVCHFTVADNGVGIAPDQRERACEMFQRLVPTDASPGTGMGLAICVKVVERHGGRLWLDASQSGGTAVHFELPAGGAER